MTTRNRISGEEKKDYCRKVKKTAHCCGEWIIAQKAKWPGKPEERDVLYFLAQSFRAKLLTELPKSKQDISGNMLSFVYRAKGMIRELSAINFEIAQMTVAADDQEALPDWFMMEVIRDLPRLVH